MMSIINLSSKENCYLSSNTLSDLCPYLTFPFPPSIPHSPTISLFLSFSFFISLLFILYSSPFHSLFLYISLYHFLSLSEFLSVAGRRLSCFLGDHGAQNSMVETLCTYVFIPFMLNFFIYRSYTIKSITLSLF